VGEVNVNGVAVPLTDFGSESFAGCYATVDGSTGPMGSFSLVQYTMVSSAGVTLASPSYSGDGTRFSILWSNPGP